jgi:hypothetical protein
MQVSLFHSLLLQHLRLRFTVPNQHNEFKGELMGMYLSFGELAR